VDRIQEIEAELARTREHQAALVAEWNTLKGADLEVRMSALIGDNSDLTLETAMQVDMGELGNRSYGSAWWKIVNNFLEEQCRPGQPLAGLYVDGCLDAGGQSALKVMLDQNRPLDEQLGAKAVLPYVNTYKGWKMFSIFEHTLSAGGSWYLRVSEDDSVAEVWEWRSLRYATEYGDKNRTPEFTGDIDAALAHIYARHPYVRLKGEYDDDDDREDW
jgi:hypothetical protein